ncbi:MAG: DUF2345 domain-containing protein, partial [Saezia sp.]
QEVYQELMKAGILISSPEGIATTTPKSTQITSNQNLTITTGQSTDISAWEDVRIGAKDKVSILAVEDELKLVANKGQMKIQAQNNQMEIAAQKGIKVFSTEDKLIIAAAEEIVLTSGGAYIRIKGGHIELHAPGIIDHKAASYPFAGPTSLNANYSLPPEAQVNLDPLKPQGCYIVSSHPNGEGLLYINEPYRLFKDGALLQEGKTDDKAAILYEFEPDVDYKIELVSGHTYNYKPEPSTSDRDEMLARSLGQVGYRYEGESDDKSLSEQRLETYFHGKRSRKK